MGMIKYAHCGSISIFKVVALSRNMQINPTVSITFSGTLYRIIKGVSIEEIIKHIDSVNRILAPI